MKKRTKSTEPILDGHGHEDDESLAHPLEPTDGIFKDLGTARMVEPDWIIEGLLPPGLTFMAGPPKSHKSTLTMAMALLVSGHPCRALPPGMSKVRHAGVCMMFSFEAEAGVLRHMSEIGLRTKVNADESILVADDPWTFRLDDPNGLAQLLFWLKERGPRLCILDPLRDFHSLEEKDSGGMNRMIRPIRQWAIESNSSVLIVHHTRKAQDKNSSYDVDDMRGSGALFGIADGVLMLTPRAENKLTMKAIFKRAKGWEQTVALSAYGTEENAYIQLTDEDRMVLTALGNGHPTLADVAIQLHLGKAKVVACMERMHRAGAVKQVNRKWVITKGVKL